VTPELLVLIRHGETSWSKAGRHTGRTDVPLTDAGRDEARALAPRLAGHVFATVLTSPLQRAVETAALAGLASRARLDDDLREWDYGDYEGLTTPEIRTARPGWLLWRDGCPGGESPGDVGRRADRVVAKARLAEGDCALVAHGHLLRILAARWAGLDPVHGGALRLDPATLSLLSWERELPVILRWNDNRHLSPGGL
jgi:probable phosphoglycerate mutase